MSRLFVACLLLVLASSIALAAPPATAKPAPPAKPPVPAAAEVGKVVITCPVTVGAAPPVDPLAPPPAVPPPPVPIALYRGGLTLFLVVGSDSDKTLLIGHVPTGTALDFQRKYVGNLGWATVAKSPTFVLTGRLTTEDEPSLFPGGVAPILNEVPVFTLGDKKRLVLVIESVTELGRFNKNLSPPEGLVSVEGPPASAKVAGVETLAVRGNAWPVVAPGRKHDAASGTLGVAAVRATGTLAVDEGLVRVQDAVVKVARK